MNRKVLSLFLSCLALIAAADSAPSNASTTTQLMAWLTAGISNKRLLRLVHERGLDVAPTISEIPQLAEAGADKDLVSKLKPAAIECDPHVWSQVEEVIRMRLPMVPQTGTANSADQYCGARRELNAA